MIKIKFNYDFQIDKLQNEMEKLYDWKLEMEKYISDMYADFEALPLLDKWLDNHWQIEVNKKVTASSNFDEEWKLLESIQ